MKKRVFGLSLLALGLAGMSANADFTLMMRDLTGGSDGNPNSTTEAEAIIALTAPNAVYQYTDYTATPDPDTINNGGAGDYGATDPLPSGSQQAETYVQRATAYLRIPAGDWTIGFGRDDGGYLRIGDGTDGFPGFINEYGTSGDAVSGDNELYFNNTGGHAWTRGTFTLAVPLVTTLDALMFESGSGDSWEIAIYEGHTSGEPVGNWVLLEDGAKGWTVRTDPITTGPFDFADLVASNITTTAAVLYATVNSNLTSATVVWDTSDKGTTNLLLWTGSNSASGTTPGMISGNATSLSADTLYIYRFYGEDLATNGWSGAATFATDLSAAQTPVFTNASTPFNAATLSWEDNADTETGYVLQRSTNGLDYALVVELDADTTKHTDTGLLSETTYYYRLAATNDINESGTSFASCSTNVTTPPLPPTTTYSGETGSSDTDTWNDADNWDGGVPSATQNAIIAVGEYASVSRNYSGADTPAYAGSLVLQTNATLEIAEGSVDADLNALGGDTITMHSGSRIAFQRSANTVHDQDIVMAGDAEIDLCRSASAHVTSRTFNGEIRGPGRLSIYGTSRNTGIFATNNPSWSGGLRATNGASIVKGNATGCFGTGDIAIDDGMSLGINATNAMDDGATLSLNGTQGTDEGAATAKLVMNTNDTVGQLLVDGLQFPAGTHGAGGSGATYQWDWISGAGVLTVASAPADSTPPVLVDISSDSGNGIYYYVLEPVTYTLTFDEAVTSSVTTASFENAGSAAVSIGSVTQTDLNEFQVVLTPSGTGRLVLQINASASFDDLFGNTLAGPITDDTTNTVVGLPPDSLIYEPFDYATGGIEGKNGGSGFAGPWDSPWRNPNVDPLSMYWGTLMANGNHIRGAGWSNCIRPIGTTLSGPRLMANGSTLWFAVIFDLENQNTTNADLNMGLTADMFDPGDYFTRQETRTGEGIGVTHHRQRVLGVYWQDDADADDHGDRITANSSLSFNVGAGIHRLLLVGKIAWGANDLAGETLTLYAPDEDLVMGDPILDSWATPALDQSTFTNVALQFKDTPKMDEIRWGASYDEVVGIPRPADGTLLMIR